MLDSLEGFICNHIGDTKVIEKAETVSLTRNLARLDSLVQLLGSFGHCASCMASCSADELDGKGSQYEIRNAKIGKGSEPIKGLWLSEQSWCVDAGYLCADDYLVDRCEISHCLFGNPEGR